MAKEPIYFSTQTRLAHFLNERYYGGRHFAWLCPEFNTKRLDSLNPYYKIPPSSSPFHIYKNFLEDVEGNDLHSDKIKNNRIGLKVGAAANLENGIIDESDFARIMARIDCALIQDFTPLIYVCPQSNIKSRIEIVSVEAASNPLSEEYKIVDLKSDEFTIMDFSVK